MRRLTFRPKGRHLTSNPWRDLEDLSDEGWSVAVTAHEVDGAPGIQLDAERRSFTLGQPSQRAQATAPSVALAAPKLLREIARLEA